MNNKVVKIDSRKFLSQINESAQSKVKLFEERVQAMGRRLGKDWKLAALHNNTLYIEDVNTHDYFLADHSKSNGKVVISNVRQLEIVEGEKKEMFNESCLKLVNAIESNDQRGMSAAFSRMRSQRFSSRVVPLSGSIMGRDGELRNIKISTDAVQSEDVKNRLVKLVVESLSNRVVVEDDNSITGYFDDGQTLKMPLTKWGTRKLIARRMRSAAENAYWSEGFQQRIGDLAKLVAEEKIEEAVNFIKPFLNEMEEFTLLNKEQTQTLVENALASRAIFNQQLCDDVSTLFYRTNIKLNKNKIVKEWRNIGKKIANSTLVENVEVLEHSKDFDVAYEKFLKMVFENISNRDITAGALATTLEVLKTKTPRIKESYDLSNKLNGLITRLKSPNFDDAAIYEAEDLIATIQEELSATDNLSQFDSMPGDDDVPDAMDLGGAGDIGGGGEKAPVININAPLIQIGGNSGAGEEEAALDTIEDLPEPEDTLDMDLGDEFGADMQAPPQGGQQPGMGAAGAAPAPQAGGAQAPLPAMESRRNRRLVESRPVHAEMNGVEDYEDDDMPVDDEDSVEESTDPYFYKGSVINNSSLTEYGAPVIKDSADVAQAVLLMQKVAESKGLRGKALYENIENLAKASLEALKIRIPSGKLNQAVDQLVGMFEEESKMPDFIKDKMKKSDDDHGDSDEDGDDKESGKPWEDDEEGVAEAQYKSPQYKKRGLKRSSITSMESINWLESQSDAKLGTIGGVNFIFDHGGPGSGLEPVILSEDGSVEIPIPKNLKESAFAAAKMRKGDGRLFERWLKSSIVQLSPITEDENEDLDEVIATIKRSGDDIKIEVNNDQVEVSGSEIDELSDEIEDVGEEFDDLEDAADMAGLDTVEAEDESEDAEMDEEMPDFEDDDSYGSEDEETEDDEEEGESEEDSEDEGEEEDETEVEFNAPATEEPATIPTTPKTPAPTRPKPKGIPDTGDIPDVVEDPQPQAKKRKGMVEDDDLTSPKHAAYKKHVHDNKRDMPDAKMPKKSDDKLEGFKDLKDYDGTGNKDVAANSLKEGKNRRRR